ASDLAMLHGFCHGRLDIGFARAFLPQEFRHFEVDMEESVERFEEGIEQVRLLLENENVTSKGKFHSFEDVTTHPRPVQKPRPNFYLAAVGTPASFERAGRLGHWIMAIPGVGSDPIQLMDSYRGAWKAAGHAGKPRIMMAVFMLCHEDREQALRIAKPHVEGHFAAIVEAMHEYETGAPASTYKGYDVMRQRIAEQTLESQIECHAVFAGTPDDIIAQLTAFDDAVGGCDEVSMQVNFYGLDIGVAEASVRLFGETVIPHFNAQTG
ncbi:MAG: LLM class flavin-dependent oxidoreductase, partial [Rhodospirillales bacterium]